MSKVNKILVSSTQHPISKLRLFKLDESQYTRSSLSARERLLLEKRAALQTWNHDYWCENNSEFQKRKKGFIQSQLKNQNQENLLNDSSQSHEELAAFYKEFLDSNRNKHIQYNFEWYKRNISLLWPAFVVKIEKFFLRKTD